MGGGEGLPIVGLHPIELFHSGHVRLPLVIAAIVGLALASLSDGVMVLSFSINRAFIASNLCEQKNIPGNTCQGCCLLRKQLAKEDHKQQSTPNTRPTESFNLQAVPVSPLASLMSPPEGQTFFLSGKSSLPFSPVRDIDHPPETFSL